MASSSKIPQPKLSVFFQASPRKRNSSFIDLTQDDDTDITVQKRMRLSATTSDANDEPRSRGTLADSWRFSPEKGNKTAPSISASGKQRHEAFKRKFLQ